jgi:hypothetical protein
MHDALEPRPSPGPGLFVVWNGSRGGALDFAGPRSFPLPVLGGPCIERSPRWWLNCQRGFPSSRNVPKEAYAKTICGVLSERDRREALGLPGVTPYLAHSLPPPNARLAK